MLTSGLRNISANGTQHKPLQAEISPIIQGDYVFDEIVPPSHEHRTIVLCFDGTGDQFDADNSNIVEFFSMLKKDDRSQQMVYYQAGIGTYTTPQIATPFYAAFSKTIDSAIGIHLNAHVMEGYEFLMQNYEAGDKICIFGFSRGAYTACALAGMIHKVGLLPADNHQQVPFAYEMYTKDDEVGWKQSRAFKKAFSVDVDIELLGVWDTVASVGIFPRFLPFVKSNTHVRHFRHALSLDEHRARFQPNLWRHPTKEELKLGVPKGEMPRSVKVSQSRHDIGNPKHHHIGHDHSTDVEEVWFAGCHCDVGGGSVVNGTRHSLARIPLRWMIRQCFLLDTGIMFHREKFKCVGLDVSTLYPVVKLRPPPVTSFDDSCSNRSSHSEVSCLYDDFVNEEVEDLLDAKSPIYDQLDLAWGWWLLEVVPLKQRYQDIDGSLVCKTRVNLGYPRHIPKQLTQGVKIHRSVKLRMNTVDLQGASGENIGVYEPRPELKVEPTWVD